MCSGIGTSLAARHCKNVDFPQPFCPIKPYLPPADRGTNTEAHAHHASAHTSCGSEASCSTNTPLFISRSRAATYWVSTSSPSVTPRYKPYQKQGGCIAVCPSAVPPTGSYRPPPVLGLRLRPIPVGGDTNKGPHGEQTEI